MQGFSFDLGPSIFTLPQIFRPVFEGDGKRLEDYITLERVDPQWRNFFEDGVVVDLWEDPKRMSTELARFGPNVFAEYTEFLSYSPRQYEVVERGYLNRGLDTLFQFLRFYGWRDARGLDYLRSMSGSIYKRLSNRYLRHIFEYFIKYVGSSALDSPAFMNLIPNIQMQFGLWYVSGGVYQLARAFRLDADTWFLDGGFDRMMSCWLREREPRLVLSLLPHHEVQAVYEQLSLFFNILMAAGAGGFGVLTPPRLFGHSLLISRTTYFGAGGHAAVSGVVLENLRWAGKLRACGARIRCLGGRGTLHMRMFPAGFRQMSQSWEKAFVQGATDSGALVLTVSTVWISALWSTTLLLIYPRPHTLRIMALLYLLLSVQLWWFARRLGTYHILTALLFPFPLAYYCIVFGRSATRAALGRKTLWKGREV
ncbi:MAG TPA: hypothetical protein VGL22_13430 [Terracidiphilus sp.]